MIYEIPVNSPAGAMFVERPNLTFAEAQAFVGGYVQPLPFHNDGDGECMLLINEEGKLEGLPVNNVATLMWLPFALPGDHIVGPAILITGKADIDKVLGRDEEEE